MEKEELKQKIIEVIEKKIKIAGKSKVYLKDLQKDIPGVSPRDIKNAANELVREGKLEYFSTGSTVMFGIPGVGMGLEAGTEKPKEE
ncbi:MAG: dissimilatory sulfite reductase D family protein [Thermodesulfobacteriaceae bacterium]|nr:dissimilatory sulfite reductase D family protein [Thermodesulfobacteriaceae bacterium]MCX8041049.1 dissimilatory sulfite reductase D family protein [Thermodesulfobacteriaceae bacterium]MDW8135613.1 dissimilatory sulfite reductase D family protein [Thermodesulfobacterium sp.]